MKLTPAKLTEKHNPSVDKESLDTYVDKAPFIRDLVEVRDLKKSRDTYLKGWLREAVDGVLHPHFSLGNVSSYRSGCSRPNLQNIPVRDADVKKLLRTAIIPSPGHQLLEADLKAAEVCVSACYHKDPVMIEYIKDPTKDMHRDMAMQLFFLGADQVTKDARYTAKNGFVFPEFYGSYWKQVAPAIWETLQKLGVSLTDGTPMFDHLKECGIKGYPDFERHVQEVEDNFWDRRFKVYSQWKLNTVEDYLRKGYLEFHTGFRISGPLDRKQIVNLPIQGSAFHCLLWSLTRLNQMAYQEGWKSKWVSQVHDSAICDLDPAEKEMVIARIKQVVTVYLPKHWKWIIVPMKIDIEIAPVNKPWFEKREEK
jgi:DNA polymerase I